MKRLHKCFLFMLSLLVLVSNTKCITKAEELEYVLADVSKGKLEEVASFDDYYSANINYLENVENYDNLVLFDNEKVLKMEYGIVEFLTDDNCSLDVDYRSIINGSKSEINGCYGIDGAYLYSSYDGMYVYFKVSGDIGYTSIDNVILHPYELLDVKTSAYVNIDGSLYHKIKTQLSLDYYSSALPLDEAPAYLIKDKNYFSYDGVYFYDDFKSMIDDYTNENNENAVNFDNPYFNYYQYLPFRSLSNYDNKDLEHYFYDTLHIYDKVYSYEDQAKDNANDVVNKSQYYDEIKSFFAYQNIYGANAMMMLSVSIGESSYGKSFNAFAYNNLFGDTAFDSEEERKHDRYSSVADSIYSYAKYYVSKKYANYRSENYSGTYFGNMLSGINSTQSNDMYWGEKAASNYYKMDKALGLTDNGSYCVGIVQNRNYIEFYKDESLNRLLFTLKGIENYPLVILEELEYAYKVQIDPSFSSDYLYDYENSVAYVNKNLFANINNSERIHNNELVEITLDENDTAKDISEISVANWPKKTIALGSCLDLNDCQLKINYTDGSSETIQIDTDMVSVIKPKEAGKQNIFIKYRGLETTIEIDVSKERKNLQDEISELIDKNINSYMENGTFSQTDIKRIKTDISKVSYVYDFNKIREIDAILLKEYRDKANYHIDENRFDLSISGLTLSLADVDITKWFKPFKDTYSVHVGEVNSADRKVLEDVGKAYGFEPVDYFSISYSLNMTKIEQNGAVIISLKLEDKAIDKTYSVYRLDENGDIVKCKTTQTTNYIQFLTKKSGKFVVLVKDSVNTYDIEDTYENITSLNSDPDNHLLFLQGSLLLSLMFLGIAVIVIYYYFDKNENKLWKDFKKSLQKVDSVQEEKPKS